MVEPATNPAWYDALPAPDWISPCGNAVLYRRDCREILPLIPDGFVDAIVTDPPYYKVKNEAWDRQWENPEKFIEWIGLLCEQWHRILAANGSLYCFASPKMAARIEVKIGEWFNVLNSIRWIKKEGWHNKTEKEALRSFLSNCEDIIFAEHYGADNAAKGEAGYGAKCNELRGFVFEPLRAYLDEERRRAGIGKDECNEACGFSRCAGGMASRHYFSASQWCLPTADHYAALQQLFNQKGGDYLRREYEDLRREYEDLRREYEDLRRPFAVSADVQYTDVWNFPTAPTGPNRHPCEKPVIMMEHIIKTSTRPDAVVFDGFAGHGSTGVAALRLGRRFIGAEIEQKHFDAMVQKITAALTQGKLAL